MRNEERLYEPLTKHDIEQLKEIALKEHEKFFERNPRLKEAYYNSLIGICLCQGAASHYLNPEVGIKDFDIWHFYTENNTTRFSCRRPKKLKLPNGYRGKPIDFLKRAIPSDIYNSNFGSPGQIIMNYLFEKNTKTKTLLLKKAIIGLYPDEIFNKILWKGELFGRRDTL